MAKFTRKLTQRAVDTIEYSEACRAMGLDPDKARQSNKRVIVWDGALPGYGLSLTARGAKSYIWFHKVGGKSRKLTVGSAAKVSAKRARELVLEAMTTVRDGGDPTRAAKQETVPTVRDAFQKFIAEPKRDGSMRAAATLRRYNFDFGRFVEPVMGDRLITEVDQRACNQALELALAKSTLSTTCPKSPFLAPQNTG